MALSKKSILADEAGEELPSPVAISVGDEIIWSANAGRVSSGLMLGTMIAEKKTVSISWGILTSAEVKDLESKIPAGFIKLHILGQLFSVYRGTLNKEVLGYIGDGTFYYRSASTDIIER